MVWNINQRFVLLCFALCFFWFGLFFSLIDSRVQKKVTLLFATKDVKSMAKPYLCLLKRLSMGV